jgi:predicted metal-dependent peptidase
MTKLSAEQRVQKAHVWLMNDPRYCLYSGVLMLGATSVEDDIPTACTDGFNTEYGRKFVDKLDDSALRGLILHENLHKAFRHTTIWEPLYQQNPQLANMACDYVINLMIVDSDPVAKDVCLPEGALVDEQYRGMDAGQVFRSLKQNGGGGNGQGNGDGNQGSQSGSSHGGFDEHDWENAKSLSQSEKEDIGRQIDQALRQGALLAGKMNGNVPRGVTEILESTVNWREALREFVNSFCLDKDVSTWRRPNRRWVDQDVYLPSLVSESVGRIVVAIDMSGSIGDNEIGKFLGEMRAIAESVRPEGVDLLYWDTAVCQHESYDTDSLGALLTTTKPKGGGGTNPQCIPDYIKNKKLKPECVIVLTDGHVNGWGTGWSAPVLWGITTKGITASHGVTITVKD